MRRLITIALMCIVPVITSSNENGYLRGIVLDQETGGRFRDINVILWKNNQRTIMGAATDREGSFFIRRIPPDTYSVEFSIFDMKIFVFDVVVKSADTVELDMAITFPLILTTNPPRPPTPYVKRVEYVYPPPSLPELLAPNVLTGQVVDAETGQSFNYTRVYICRYADETWKEYRRFILNDGKFYFAGLDTGYYTISFFALGYKTKVLPNILVGPNIKDLGVIELEPITDQD